LKQARAKLEQERIAAEERSGLDAERTHFSQLASETARIRAEAIAKIAEALEQLAEGNFAAPLPDLGEDFDKLRTGFHKMIDAVSETVREIKAM